MNPILQKQFDEIEAQRTNLFLLVKDLEESKLNYQYRPDKWSINQILTHLLTAEELSIRYMQKKSQGIEKLGDSGFVESLKLMILNISQRVPLKYNAPKVVVAHTPQSLTLSEITSRWDNVRLDLKSLLEEIKDDHIKRLIYKHVIVGRLDVIQAMKFFIEHINHHLPQINRLLKVNSVTS